MSQQTLSPACERERARSATASAIAGNATLGDQRDGRSRPSAFARPALSLDSRDSELETVASGLTSTSGPHFWLVVAPPKFGKTWFLHRLSTRLQAVQSAGWRSTYVDLREHSDALYEAERLVAFLFGLNSAASAERLTPDEIAHRIMESRRSYLCMLDSAELLDENSAGRLRSYLGHVHTLVRESAQTNIRLGVVVASRSDNGWRGLTPNPRLSLLPLGTFERYAVQGALEALAGEMGRKFDAETFKDYAARAYGVTDGLPALLKRCLEWIQSQQWQGMERLESRDFFEDLSEPYIDGVLLADDSLFSPTRHPSSGTRPVLHQALRFLVPYRLFTQSHLRYLLDSDNAFAAAVLAAGWSLADLWRALSGTALLQRPLDEPWQEIHPAIRRLLYRYYYQSHEQRADAHREAQNFVQIWAGKQSGRERAIGMVESLWHEASFLRLTRPSDMASVLSESARKLSLALRPSDAWTADELRGYAASSIKQDEEFKETVGNITGLADRLAELIITPA